MLVVDDALLDHRQRFHLALAAILGVGLRALHSAGRGGCRDRARADRALTAGV
jgi:hypothetical protein